MFHTTMRRVVAAVAALALWAAAPAAWGSVTTNWSLTLHDTSGVSLATILTTINSNLQMLDGALLTPSQKNDVLDGAFDPVTGDNSETIDNQTDDIWEFQGVGGVDDTDLAVDLDGTRPRFYSPTDSAIQLDGVIYLERLIVNDDGADVDSRIEGDIDANLFYVDAGNDRVGIGTATPAYKLEVQGDVGLGNGGSVVFIRSLTNEPTVRINTTSNEIEYRDEDEAGWTSLDSLAGALNSFETWNAPAGTDPVADSGSDTINITAGTGMTITGTAGTDTIDFAVNEAGLSLSNIGGSISDTQIAAGAVDGGAAGEIADGSITADDLGSNSVDTDELAADSVNDLKVDWGTGANQVNAADVPIVSSPGATQANLEAHVDLVGSGTSDNANPHGLGFADVDGTVGDTQIAAGAVDGGAGGEIADGSITADDLGTGSVGSDELAADSVNDLKIDWGTGANQVSADDVPDGATNVIITSTQEGKIHDQNTDTGTSQATWTVGEGTGDGSNETILFDEALTNEPGIRINSTSNEVEYRDEDESGWTSLDSLVGGTSNSFETWDAPAGTDPVADSATDTINITAGTGMTITGTAGTDAIDFAVTDDGLDFSSFKDIMPVDAATKLGDATNYTQIETDGEIGAFGGTARPAKVLLFRADALEDVHSNVTQGEAGGFTNFAPETLEFADANDMAVNYARLAFFMSEDFDSSKSVEVEIHCFSDTANGSSNTVRIQLKSIAFGDSDALDTALSNAAAFNLTPDATAKDLEIKVQTYADGFAAGEWCVFEIARDGDDATNDTFTGSLEVTAVVLRYWRSKLTQE